MKIRKHKFLMLLGISQMSFTQPIPQQEFITRVQVKVQEPTPLLIDRSIRVINDEFDRNLHTFPGLEKTTYEVRRTGDEIAFSLITDEDLQKPLQDVVARMVQVLNGRVLARGRTQFYRTAFPMESQRYFKVVFEDNYTEIEASSVPLGGLLRAIKGQIEASSRGHIAPTNGEEPVKSFGYAISTECAEKAIDWSYKSPQSKDIKSVMKEIASIFKMDLEIKPENYFIFSGNCQQPPNPSQHVRPIEAVNERFFAPEVGPGLHRHVYFPLLPIHQ